MIHEIDAIEVDGKWFPVLDEEILLDEHWYLMGGRYPVKGTKGGYFTEKTAQAMAQCEADRRDAERKPGVVAHGSIDAALDKINRLGYATERFSRPVILYTDGSFFTLKVTDR